MDKGKTITEVMGEIGGSVKLPILSPRETGRATRSSRPAVPRTPRTENEKQGPQEP